MLFEPSSFLKVFPATIDRFELISLNLKIPNRVNIAWHWLPPIFWTCVKFRNPESGHRSYVIHFDYSSYEIRWDSIL